MLLTSGVALAVAVLADRARAPVLAPQFVQDRTAHAQRGVRVLSREQAQRGLGGIGGGGAIAAGPERRNGQWTRGRLEELLLSVLGAYERASVAG